MLAAAGWGLLGGGALVLGAAIGLLTGPSQRVIAVIMAFGAGVLISALTFELTEEAFRRGGATAVAGGLAGGALAFFAADWLVDRRGGRDRKRSGGQQAGGSAAAIVIGALMDGIPESAAIGLTLIEGGGVGVAVVAAVFLSNLPDRSPPRSACVRRAGAPAASWRCGPRWRWPRRSRQRSATACSTRHSRRSSAPYRPSPPGQFSPCSPTR